MSELPPDDEGAIPSSPFAQDDVFADRLWKGVWHD